MCIHHGLRAASSLPQVEVKLKFVSLAGPQPHRTGHGSEFGDWRCPGMIAGRNEKCGMPDCATPGKFNL